MANERARALGFDFITDDKYLRSPFKAPTVEEEKITETFGIPATQAFTNSGGGGGGGGGGPTGELISGFNTATGNRQYNLNNPNKVNQFVNKGMEMFGMTPQRSVRDMLSPQDLNFGRNEFNEDTLSYDRTNMPGVLQPDVRKTSGIPLGIGAMIARALPDKYYDMNTVDQAYTQANMGYTGPTIFGDNSLGNKDPFGRNVRSAFGNYAEAQQKSIDKLEEHFGSKSLEEHGAEWDEEKGEFVGPNAVEINRLNKMNLSRYNFDKKGLDRYGKIKDISQQRKQQREDYEKKTGQELDAADRAFRRPDGGDYDEYAGAGGTPNYSIPDTNDPGGGGGGYSQERNDAGVQSAEDDMKDGGRAGYFFGGRARLQGGGMSQGNQSNIEQSTNMGGGTTGDFSTPEQNMNHREAMRNNQREQSSTLNNVIDTGSELNHLKNLKNFDVPGLIFGFGANKIRNYLGNKKKEDEKLSYNTNALPTNNYTAKLVGPALAQMRTLEKAKGMEQFGGPFSTEQQEGLNKLQQMDQEETIYSQPIFVGANGGRVNFKNGGLASIL